VAVPALARGRTSRRRRAGAAGLAALALVVGVGAARAQTRAPELAPPPPLPAPASASAIPESDTAKNDKEGPPRLSLPTEADRDAWLRDGFRLGIGLHTGEMFGLEGAPRARLIGATIRLGLRLDADWSILASFQYGVMSRGLTGLRFSGTLDPTWHATRHLSLALGLGFAGISGGSTGGADIAPLPSTLDSSYTFPSANPPLPSCTGGGLAALARAEWAIVLGARSATTFGLEAFGQWTGCVDDTGLVEPDTGQAIVRRQFWPHVGVTGTWGILWR
jgi:hypothetical protein